MTATAPRSLLRRRSLLGATALMVGGLAACSVETGGSDGPAPDEAAGDFEFAYDPEASDSAQLLWMDSGDLKSVFISAVIDAFGEQFPEVTTQYDGSGWDQVNQVYAEFFGDHRPARVVVPSRALHGGALVEVEAVAELAEA